MGIDCNEVVKVYYWNVDDGHNFLYEGMCSTLEETGLNYYCCS